MIVKPDKPFFLYFRGKVLYFGRAESTLQEGNYAVLHKGDGSLMIHGNRLVNPLNYQSSKSIMTVDGNKIVSERKGEVIEIHVDSVIDYYEIHDWSSHKIDISKTENDLRDKIISNINSHFDNVLEIHKEYQTPLGPIDLLVVNEVYNVIEIKRKRASLNACTQLERYLGYFEKIGQPTIGYIFCPSMTDNALNYMDERGLKFVSVDFG